MKYYFFPKNHYIYMHTHTTYPLHIHTKTTHTSIIYNGFLCHRLFLYHSLLFHIYPWDLFFNPQFLLSKSDTLTLNIKMQHAIQNPHNFHMVLSSSSPHHSQASAHIMLFNPKSVNLANVRMRDPSHQTCIPPKQGDFPFHHVKDRLAEILHFLEFSSGKFYEKSSWPF